ncbi:MAG: FAD-dependent thymidylate synthase [Alphaproteobacteria bacterium RIFCSPHIGHO2_01_FULL_41_14]|nr:MAG: FAD-dependent thymidylate synthase [Alphaproteobacteria bacterium GWB1_45_5]OFW76437.1 MAG: FAD-dependent thymidylate synthase [Alphaproteobacteria bacterium GWA1_45_9]OFW89541.1 MAG: FAD-dependent thymidylate synthase [Alphaproteobacteria bacterium RIFCSPHIGHO2_01_FULL_41_14]HCI48907.1 FAD-dependent thymidylate synthase [Holosporales bacterium]
MDTPVTLLTQEQEIEVLRSHPQPTLRPVCEEVEKILYKPFPLLDHGFLRVIDYMGDDAAIVQAARVSYGKGTKRLSDDKALINYLLRHRHNTPFEMCEIKIHAKMPIFVARDWIRHRTANVNEYSARYSILENEFYVPSPDQLGKQSQTNRQGREDVLEGQEAARALELLKRDALQCYDSYQELLNEDGHGNVVDKNKKGLARELARINLPVSVYTQWYWKIDLSNLMHFLSLRADPHAQYELRVYAEVMLDIVKKWVPLAYEAFMNYRKNGVHLSGKGLATVKEMIAGKNPTAESMGMGQREWGELMEILGKN